MAVSEMDYMNVHTPRIEYGNISAGTMTINDWNAIKTVDFKPTFATLILGNTGRTYGLYVYEYDIETNISHRFIYAADTMAYWDDVMTPTIFKFENNTLYFYCSNATYQAMNVQCCIVG